MNIIILCGPTATGKTALSIAAAKRFQCEILSADSIQVYKGLDIGSAKPTMEERAVIPHHLIDILDVTDADFSVARYKRLADTAIEGIAARGCIPLVVGGTGLYVNALSYPLHFTQVPGDPAVRERLLREEAASPGSLYKKLRVVDPERAACLHANDRKRVVRALEVYEISGRTQTSYGADFQNAAALKPPYEAVMVGLTMEREALYKLINRRVDLMMEQGLLEETRRYAHLSPALPALSGLGYKQLLAHIRGECGLDEAVALIKQETRRFAKRQWTWFNRDKRIHWLDAGKENLADEFMKYLEKEGLHDE